MLKNILLISLSLLFVGCDSENHDTENLDIDTVLISKGDLYGNGAEGIVEQNLIITEESTWNNLVIQMNSANNVSDDFTELDIDFNEYDVIAVFDELKANSGHELDLNITSNSYSIIVTVTDLNPEGNVLGVMTQPYHIVKILKSNLPIVFE